jgi:hypothetical protein
LRAVLDLKAFPKVLVSPPALLPPTTHSGTFYSPPFDISGNLPLERKHAVKLDSGGLCRKVHCRCSLPSR